MRSSERLETGDKLNGDSARTLPAATRTTLVESVATGLGVLLIGAAYVTGVISSAGLTVTVGIALTLAGVMIVVAAWLAERTDRQSRLILTALDRHERNRAAEYGAVMRKLMFVEGHADNLIGQTMQRIDDMGERIEQMRVACDSAEARRNVEHHAALDTLSESFASELLAINGAMGGLKASVDDALRSRTIADEIYKTAADLGVNPTSFLIEHKAEAIRTDSADPSREIASHLPYCATVNSPLAGPESCDCTERLPEAEGE